MSWLTPFQNLIIRFKIGSGGSSSGGITEELLNSKLAAFYTATETKILNLVNSKLATYVTQTAFNELETKVETNTTNISNLEAKVNKITTGSGAKLSHIRGTINTIDNLPKTFQNFTYVSTISTGKIKLEDDTIINIDTLNKYIISFDYSFDTIGIATPELAGEGNGWFVKLATDSQYLSLGDSSNNLLEVLYLTAKTTPTTVTWRIPPYFTVDIILSDTVENITAAINKKSMKLNTIALTEPNVINVTSWKDIG